MVLKGKPRKKTTSPIFASLIDYEIEPFWRQLLHNASEGYFPHRTGFGNGNLFFKNPSGKFTSLQLQGVDDHYLLLERIKNFFEKVAGVIPDTRFDEVSLISTSAEVLDWKRFKKPSIFRSVLIWNYLKKQPLSEKEREDLHAEIVFGLLDKSLNGSNFEFGTNEILNYIPSNIVKFEPVKNEYRPIYHIIPEKRMLKKIKLGEKE